MDQPGNQSGPKVPSVGDERIGGARRVRGRDNRWTQRPVDAAFVECSTRNRVPKAVGLAPLLYATRLSDLTKVWMPCPAPPTTNAVIPCGLTAPLPPSGIRRWW